jgi:hypothetical protein
LTTNTVFCVTRASPAMIMIAQWYRGAEDRQVVASRAAASMTAISTGVVVSTWPATPIGGFCYGGEAGRDPPPADRVVRQESWTHGQDAGGEGADEVRPRVRPEDDRPVADQCCPDGPHDTPVPVHAA